MACRLPNRTLRQQKLWEGKQLLEAKLQPDQEHRQTRSLDELARARHSGDEKVLLWRRGQ